MKEKLIIKEKKKIEVDENPNNDVAENLKSKEDYDIDNVPKLQYRGERKKEIVGEIVEEKERKCKVDENEEERT